VPTLEAGGGADTLIPTYFAFAAPAGTPPAMDKLNELKKALADPAIAGSSRLRTRAQRRLAMRTTVSGCRALRALVQSIGIKPE
jgi:hypothetical protein